MARMDHPLGIDFGGTGIKGAPVDLAAGDFAAPKVKIEHPAAGDADRGGRASSASSWPTSRAPPPRSGSPCRA